MAMRMGELDAALLQLAPGDFWDVRTAFTHTLVLGTTGSGKTSSTMAFAMRAFLKASFGMLVCVAKPEDAESIIRYCHETGRAASLINWTGGKVGYNFLGSVLNQLASGLVR